MANSALQKLSPVAQHAFKSLPPRLQNATLACLSESPSPIQLAYLSAYVVKSADQYSSLKIALIPAKARNANDPNGVT